MKFNNPSQFDGKYIVKATGNKIDAYDGSNLTGLKFTQLTDIGSPSGNKVLVTNPNGDGLDYIDMNFNAVKEISITNQDSDEITWNGNTCNVEHGLNGHVFIQLYDNENNGVPVIPNFVDNNHISFYLDEKPGNDETYKLVCLSGRYSMNNTNVSNESSSSETTPEEPAVEESSSSEKSVEPAVVEPEESSSSEEPSEPVTEPEESSSSETTPEESIQDITDLSWQQVSGYVKAGKGAELFPVGTTFIVEHTEYSTSTSIPGIAFTVLGHDQVPCADETISHTMCLGMSEILFTASFDEKELEYAITEDTKTIAGKTYYTYDGSSYTELVEGTDYQIDDDVPVATYYEKNLTDRHTYGSNNFAESNLLQWANSDGSANSWFEKKTIFDVCGDTLKAKNGFLKYLDSNFLSVVKDAKLITAKNKEEGGGSSIVNAKFWPLSRTQVDGSLNNDVMENERLTYFETNSAVKTLLNSIKSVWWLRSPRTGHAFGVYFINTSGAWNGNGAWCPYGVSLACIIG